MLISLIIAGPAAGQGLAPPALPPPLPPLPAGLATAPLCRPDPAAIPAVNACIGPTRVSVALVGDVLLHEALQRIGYRYGFHRMWGAAVPILRGADIAIANLEGPTAPGLGRGGRRLADPGPVVDGQVHSGYPAFNYHPSVIDALLAAGIDAVSTANNHALDRGAAGASATIAELDSRGMAFTGTVHPGQPRAFAARLPTALGDLVLIACSYGTNGIPDRHRQVLLCFDERAELLALVRAESARPGVAGVIVLPHWGTEYSHHPSPAQRRLGRDLAAAGALAVVGTHPHVVQPWERLTGPRGQVPVIHSTGNFVAGQVELPRATGLMAWLELCPTARGVAVGAAGHLPMVMQFHPGVRLTVPGPDATGRGAQARALLARLVPGTDLAGALVCTAPRQPRQPRPPRPVNGNLER